MKKRFKDIEKRFPDLLNDRYIEADEGWANIIWDLFIRLEEIRRLEKNMDIEPLKIVQIKSKFGTLRVYLDMHSSQDIYIDRAYELIDVYSDLSAHTCEICGKQGRTIDTGGWLWTLCDKHERNYRERQD